MDVRDLSFTDTASISGHLAFSRYRERDVYSSTDQVSSTSSTPVLPSVLPSTTFGTVGGFHRYQPVSTPELLPGDAVSLRSEPSSRTALMGEQPNPWDLLQPQDAMSRHRGAKQGRLCGLLGPISLLSPE